MWAPASAELEESNLARFLTWARSEGRTTARTYEEAHDWSIRDLDGFWRTIWDHAEVRSDHAPTTALAADRMPGARWFPGTSLNYAERVFQSAPDDRHAPALVAVSEIGACTWSWARLEQEVAGLRAYLQELGVQRGDRVVGYLPNVGEAVVAFLATASLGAVWASCNPDLGAQSVTDRFGQLEPRVLIASTSHRYAGRRHDRTDTITAIREALPTLEAVILVSDQGAEMVGAATPWSKAVETSGDLAFDRVAFDHPLWVLFSSGTTGTPKGIVHGHGGILLEHYKYLALQFDLGPDDRYFWHATTSWVMWNLQVSGLLTGATIVLYDGSPTHPSTDRLWKLVAEHEVTVFGTSAGYLLACEKQRVRPADSYDLHRLRSLGSTGSPLPPSGYVWVQEAVSTDIPVVSTSGGTDVATAFVGGAPLLPVRAGEISGACLGAAVEAWDADGTPVIDQVGELVITRPMPSMPTKFWNDPDGARYRSAYFDMFPGVWRQGDWVTVTPHGGVVVHGRSDATLNRGGVRLGSAEIYQAVEKIDGIEESLVVGVELPDGGYWLPLFVKLRAGEALDTELERQIADAIRQDASPRHVPDEVIHVEAFPHTLTGKRLEIPIKRILQGAEPDDVLNVGSIDEPALIDQFVSLRPDRATDA